MGVKNEQVPICELDKGESDTSEVVLQLNDNLSTKRRYESR